MTIIGSCSADFAWDVKELSLPAWGDDRLIEQGPVRIEVAGFSQTPRSMSLSLRASSNDLPSQHVYYRLLPREVVVLDAMKRSYRGTLEWSSFGGECCWEFEFPAAAAKAERVGLRWVQEFRKIEIPFRFENVPLPKR
jgi:hypothetical protein